MADIVFHVPESWLRIGSSGLRPFYAHVLEGLKARDIHFDVKALNRETLPETVAEDSAIHVVHHGRFAHERVRNADVAYIYPFWNFDPKGIRAFSSIAEMTFPQDDIDPQVARPFFRRLRKRIVGRRISRYPQPEAVSTPGDIRAAVFLQSEGHRAIGETCYLDRWEMLAGVCEAVDGPVVVKHHPRDRDLGTLTGLRDMCARYPHLSVSEGNLHDLVSAADRVVTINSAVGMEAYLHRKPVILCGQSDFHHVADVARSVAGLEGVLRRAPRKRVYDKFIWWYFAKQCLSGADPDLVDRFLQRCKM